MKPVPKLAAYILLITTIAFVACKKDKTVSSITNPSPPPAPLSQNKMINVRVVEYNTGNSIPGVAINLRPDYPNGNKLDLITDQNEGGSFFSTTNKIGYISVAKPGYWNAEPFRDLASPILFYPDTTQYGHYGYENVYSCDSFVVKLFSIWNITVHIKDTSGYNRNAGFSSRGLFSLNGTNYERYGSWIGLRPNIDTTYQLPVFGNADNKFRIWKCSDDDCTYWYETLSQVHYIAVGNNITVNIFY